MRSMNQMEKLLEEAFVKRISTSLKSIMKASTDVINTVKQANRVPYAVIANACREWLKPESRERITQQLLDNGEGDMNGTEFTLINIQNTLDVCEVMEEFSARIDEVFTRCQTRQDEYLMTEEGKVFDEKLNERDQRLQAERELLGGGQHTPQSLQEALRQLGLGR